MNATDLPATTMEQTAGIAALHGMTFQEIADEAILCATTVRLYFRGDASVGADNRARIRLAVFSIGQRRHLPSAEGEADFTKWLMRRHNMSAGEIARAGKVSVQSVCKWLDGDPSLSAWCRRGIDDGAKLVAAERQKLQAEIEAGRRRYHGSPRPRGRREKAGAGK